MSILQKDKSLKDNNSLKDRLLLKRENSYETLFFLKEKTYNIFIISSITLFNKEIKYLTFSEFIYNNPNGNGYYQTSTESIYPRIIITKNTDPLFVQDAMDFGFVDWIYLSPNCDEILNDTLGIQLCNMTSTRNYRISYEN